ncbi:MAG: hypothetical protein Q4B28_05330 [bacterium]|nr:hypothetical protein [bacterium]
MTAHTYTDWLQIIKRKFTKQGKPYQKTQEKADLYQGSIFYRKTLEIKKEKHIIAPVNQNKSNGSVA